MAIRALEPRRLLGAAVLASTALLSACGGGSSAVTAAPTISGVAAVGLPIVSGTVKVTCAGGSALNTTTNSAGGWTVTTSGQTLPCAVQVSGGTVSGVANTTPYHSIAINFGTVNITPLTDLAVAQMLAGPAPATWFATPTFGTVNATTLNAALSTLSASLGLATTLGTVNPFTTAFVPQNGVMLDNVLEAIKTTLTNLGQNYAALLAAAQANNFVTNFSGFSAGFGAAYVAPVVSGATGATSGATSCSTGQTLLVYAGGASKYSVGQGVCFTANSTSLSFLSKTLTNPVANTGFYTIADTDTYSYEVVISAGALQEINVLNNGTFVGQFGHTLTIVTNISGVATPAIVVSGVTVPVSQTTFCTDILTDNSLTSLTASGGSLTIDSCSFTNNVGTIAATLRVTSPISITTPYTISYTYN